jgi:hypothetical protein
MVTGCAPECVSATAIAESATLGQLRTYVSKVSAAATTSRLLLGTARRLFIDDFIWDKAGPLIGRMLRCVCGKGGDAEARDPSAAKMLPEVVEVSKRDALAAIGGHDADIRYIAEAVGVGCLGMLSSCRPSRLSAICSPGNRVA